MSVLKEKAKVHLLPVKQNQQSNIVIKNTTKELVYLPTGHIGTNHSKLTFPHHIYITSNEEIKGGDWVIYEDKLGKVREEFPEGFWYVDLLNNKTPFSADKKLWRKVIATTDKSLHEHPNHRSSYHELKSLPQPSESFVKKFIEEYNKGNVIKEVMVEYEELYVDDNVPGGYKPKSKLKVNPKDDAITITKVKDSWNREEIKQLLGKMGYDLRGHHPYSVAEINEWIEDNL